MGRKVSDIRQVREMGKFVKGVSGNPGGRPKGNPEVKEILKAASPEAARVLVSLLHSEKDSIRLTAAQDILDRTEGKAIQAQSVNMEVGVPSVEMQVRKILMECMNVSATESGSDDGNGTA